MPCRSAWNQRAAISRRMNTSARSSKRWRNRTSSAVCHVIHTSSGDRKIPVVASKGTASWIDEEAAYPESDDSFGQVSIGAYKLATMIKVSEELLNDSVFDLPSYIAREFARRIGAAEEDAFFNGNGTGKPLGILAATGGAETGVTAASATAITMDEVIDLFYSLRAPYRRKRCVHHERFDRQGHPQAEERQRRLPVAAQPDGSQPDTLLNRPIYTSSYMPAIAASTKLSCSAIWATTGWLTGRAVPSSG